jgi:hypothetical protein
MSEKKAGTQQQSRRRACARIAGASEAQQHSPQSISALGGSDVMLLTLLLPARKLPEV